MDSSPDSPTAAAIDKLPLPGRMKALLVEYGVIALAVFFVTFLITISGVFLALQFGWKTGGASTSAGTFLGTLAAAYLITLATKPVRIGVTLAVTPAVGALWKRLRKPAVVAAVAASPASSRSTTGR